MAALAFAMLLQQHLPLICILAVLLHVLRNYFKPGVRSIPGPLAATLSNLWRLYDVAQGRPDLTLYKLHVKYGDYVRIGPNVVSINNLETLKTVYGINKGYVKSDFYRVQQQMANGKPTVTLFTSLNEDWHATIKRPIANAYSMTTLTEFEPFVDTVNKTLLSRLDELYTDQGKQCNIAEWLQFYAFDVIGEMTFGRTLGFLEQGRDVGGIISSLESSMDYNAVVGQMPWLDYLLIKNPLRQMLGGSTGAVARFAREQLNKRLAHQEAAHGKSSSDTSSTQLHRDFLTRFLEAKEKFPSVVTDAQVFSYTVTNVFAGSDTTAISLRAIVYYCLKHPDVAAKLTRELDDAAANGRLSFPATWKQSQELKYLDAVIKEALRLHPAVGLPLERIVPRGGLLLANGVRLPAGTIVGASPWIVHRNEQIFGAEPNAFNPDRWLQAPAETPQAFRARREEMDRGTFTFGSGPRTCIGKNISLLEIYKLIPSMFYYYELKLVDPAAEWKLQNSWFVRQKNMDIKLRRRKPEELF